MIEKRVPFLFSLGVGGLKEAKLTGLLEKVGGCLFPRD